MCKAAELAEVQLKTLTEENKIEVIKRNKASPPEERSQSCKRKFYLPQKQQNIKSSPNYQGIKSNNSKPCRKCGTFHKLYNCPAYNKICFYCKKKNHFSKMCTNKSVSSLQNYIENELNYNDNEYILGSVEDKNPFFKNKTEWFEKLKVNISKYLYVKLDTGAQCNVLPLPKFKQLNLRDKCLTESKVTLNNYNGSKIDVIGKCKLLCETSKGDKDEIEFQVVACDKTVPAILGLPTLQKLNLVQRICTVNPESSEKLPESLNGYQDLFKGIGNLTGYTYHIKLKPEAVGKIEPCRKIPLSLLNPLKKELARMEKDGIIKKVNKPTEFVNSLVIVRKKDGNLRVCLDPQYLNQNILREHYHIPTFEEISSQMSNAKVFSILDANKAFWQIKLSDSSCELTTFNTPFGRYCFLRLPYGLCSSPEVFHRSFSEIFSDIEGVQIYIDDLLVWGKDKQEHDLRLKKVLERAREKNVKFNLNKCKIGLNEVKYMGHIFSKDGLKPDEDKIKAIININTPKNVKELETFLGMITYVSRFIPNVSELTSCLRDLLKKHVVWNWNAVHEKTFRKLKNILVNKPVLQYYDINMPVVLSVDASQEGLGAVLLQNNLPVAYASKALTDTQKNYAQIEKETLAIVFACEKFHQYIFGKCFIVESDHKPLETIFKKPLNKCPVRLQRMRIRLQPYQFEIKYKPGKELFIADALSRSFTDKGSDFFEGDIEAHVGMVVESIPVSKDKMENFQQETGKDEELQVLRKLIKTGWPDTKCMVPELAKPYFNFREELSEANGLIFKNSCVVVPKSLRKDMLSKIHYGHLGVEKCKNKAREILYWPGMSKEIEDLVLNCPTCLSLQKANCKEPMICKEIPNGPWEVLGTDLFYFQGRDYLIVIDYFSKYVEIGHLEDLSSVAVIKQLKSFFARHGIPKIVYSDNGPQYSSKKFKEFARRWNFETRTSSPNYPQSNGMVERHIQTVKRMLEKAVIGNKDPYLVLLEYRNSPISAEIKSPSELMFGRKVNGLVPIKENFIQTKEHAEHKQQLLKRQALQKKYYDKSARPLKPLKIGDNVYINEKGKNLKESGKIMGQAERPRSYRIIRADGRIIERNRRDILKGTNRKNFIVQNNYENESDKGDISRSTPTLDLPVNPNSDLTLNPNLNLSLNSPIHNRSIVPLNSERSVVSPNSVNGHNYVTRSGRTVKKPYYLKDPK
ncbi:Transposon Ty3-I Gag-Pol polyprotein, partial [Stegodyphus mimosarum]